MVLCVMTAATKSKGVWRGASVCVLSMACFLSSCIVVPRDRAYVGPRPREDALQTIYTYAQDANAPQRTPIKEKRSYLLERIDLHPGTGQNVSFDFYQPRGSGPFPAVLMLPISGGVDICIEGFARYFAKRGWCCAVLYARDFQVDQAQEAHEVEAYLQQIVVDCRRVLDFLSDQPTVDAERLGCLGVSLGAIQASLVAGIDPRIRCTVLALGGGSLADVSVSSWEPKLKRGMRQWEKRGVTKAQVHEALQKVIQTDPLYLAPYLDARRTLLFLALFDRAVPRYTGEQLRRVLGKPQTVYFLSGHYGAFLYMAYAHHKAYTFMRQHLGP